MLLSSAQLAEQLTRIGGRHEARRLTHVVSDAFSDAREIRQHLQRAEDRECSATEKVHDALRKEIIRKKKLTRACKSPDASAAVYKARTLNVLRKQMSSAASDSLF